MKYNIKKYTRENRFDRKYYCQNARKFIKHVKKYNRKKFRRILKKY